MGRASGGGGVTIMCHSVEMYLPQMTQRAAAHRIGAADIAAAERERWAVDSGLGPIGRVKRFAAYVTFDSRVFTREHISNILKYNRNRFKRVLWLGRRESHRQSDAAGAIDAKCIGRAGAEPVALKVRA